MSAGQTAWRRQFVMPDDSGSPLSAHAGLHSALEDRYLADEIALLGRLLPIAELPPLLSAQTSQRAARWVSRVRRLRDERSPLDAFMQEYDLSSEEGVLLMCLAEALLRIPDEETAEKLIADKLASADWESHLGGSDSLFVNASTWGLMLTGRIVRLSPQTTGNFRAAINRMVGKSTEPVIRLAVRQAMRLMGSQFVMGRTIEDALRRTQSREQRRFLHSFDMLGEAALTAEDAARYLRAYELAIVAIGQHAGQADTATSVFQRPGISVKLSALHPRYEFAQHDRLMEELRPRLLHLAQLARGHQVGLTLDAEEADRLELSLELFAAVFADASMAGWEGFGLVVQAFGRRAIFVVEWLEQLARSAGRRIPLRLVKGAYWDTEVKRAQEQGLADYPVFTRKLHTDVAYLACARRMLAARDAFYPMFASHNAHTLSAVVAMAGDASGYEFQRLHGMGEALHAVIAEEVPVPCRVYAPVGAHADLLPYLVRRLLENGANTSFVNRIFDEQLAAESLVEDPVVQLRSAELRSNPALPRPADLFAPGRRNSAGCNLADGAQRRRFKSELEAARFGLRAASLLGGGLRTEGGWQAVSEPADRRRALGQWQALAQAQVADVVGVACAAHAVWNRTGVEPRAGMLERAADRLDARRADFVHLLVREAGKTLVDALAEVREAIDFLRYYAIQARQLMAHPQPLPGPTGEHNELQLHGKGVFVCISPWNFPLAIFSGQIAAALVTGNAVIAKPAEQTNLVAHEMVGLLHDCGVPRDVLQLALGDGAVGAALVGDPRIAGVAFTGSVEVAQAINRALAARTGPIATLIAETGGQNAMLVDSSALPEQVVRDVLWSAFYSAGQRCSALRVLLLQEEIAGRTLRMLSGAMQELVIGDPALLATDIGPVIDEAARDALQAHATQIVGGGRLIRQLALPEACVHGCYVAPLAVEIDAIGQLEREHFGPILHVVRYRARDLEQVVEGINATGYGLTLGVHSRIESTWRRVQALARVGNCYINRGMTGAVVGCQPFGGEGLSGTGPKAGGPNYLLRFVSERSLTVNTAAVGGNARLLAASG